jgi:hypothetical protein
MGRRATVSLARLSSSATAYLSGRMTGTRRMGRRPFPTRIAILPSPTPHPAAPAPPISLLHHCATFPFRSGCAASTHSRPPTAPTPRTVSTYAIVAVYRLSCLGPRHPVHGYGVSNPESEWGADGLGGVGCYARVQALARRGGRRRRKCGMGRGAMEAPARRSGAGSCSEEGCGVP